MSTDIRAEQLGKLASMPHRETLRMRLERNRDELADRLEEVHQALLVLDKNPEMERFHDIVSKAGY